MTNLKEEALDYVKQKMGACFGSEDGIFAGHPFDEGRAKELRKFASDKGLTLEEVIKISLAYMQNKKYIREHIDEQMVDIKKFFAKKLS